MSRWDEENFNTNEPKGMMCSTCKYKLKPVTVAGYTQDRAGYSSCYQFTRKPEDILWDGAQCMFYKYEGAD